MLLGLGAVACGGDDDADSGGDAAPAEESVLIGWSSYPADAPVIGDAIGGAKTAAKELGVEVDFALKPDANGQASDIDTLLAKGVDVLAIDPNDSNAIGPSVRKANEAGVPVVMWVGDNLGGGETETLISNDEEAGGHQIASWGFEKLGGSGEVGLVQGTKAHQAGALREEGFRRALKEYPDIELVAYGEADFQRDQANTLAADFLVKEPNVEMIFGFTDEMAKGIFSAVEAGNSDARVVGLNGDCETLESIWKGGITATLYQGWRDIGRQVVETSTAVARGEKVEAKIIMPAFVMDKAAMQEVVDGTYPDATEALTTDVKRAVASECG